MKLDMPMKEYLKYIVGNRSEHEMYQGIDCVHLELEAKQQW